MAVGHAAIPSTPPDLVIHQFQVGGSLRVRYENQDDFKFGAASPANRQDYVLTQLRLNATWVPMQSVKLFVEAQDARVHTAFQDNAVNDRSAPNIFKDSLSIHQAYLDLKLPIGEGTSKIRMGRQKFNLGAQRLVASLEWVNTARVWDGVRATLELPRNRVLDAIASRVVPIRPDAFNSHAHTGKPLFDSRFFALYYRDPVLVPHTGMEGYLLLRQDPSVDDEVYTVGTRADYHQGSWDADGEVAGQFGTFQGLSHRAAALHVGAGYTLQQSRTHLGMAYNYGSGDSDPNDRTHQTFDNQYPLNHAYYGYMDFFSLQNIHNVEAVVTQKFTRGIVLRIAYQDFWLVKENSDAWYNAGAGTVRRASTDVDPHVGREIDISVAVPMDAQKLAFLVGYSHFFSAGFITDTGPDSDADFMFLQAKVSF